MPATGIRTREPDYELLDQALVLARAEYPNAYRIQPHWTPDSEHQVICSVQLHERGGSFMVAPVLA